MPLLLGAKGKEILQWRACAELVSSFRSTLAQRWDRSSAREAESLLNTLMQRLGAELQYEEELSAALAGLDEELAGAASVEELKPVVARYREQAAAHFARRESVLSCCAICNRLHDQLLAKAVSLAKERMLQLGQGPAPLYALLVSGDRGRGEQTLYSQNRYLVLHEEQSPRFYLFSRQLAVTLREAGLLCHEQLLWHGSLADWRETAATAFSLDQLTTPKAPALPILPFAAPPKQRPQEVPDWEWPLEAMTDLLPIEGDPALAAHALQATAPILSRLHGQGAFQQLARRVIALPLAMGRFGRWRFLRDGEHEGEIDLEESALAPLVMTIRVLAVQAGVWGGGTLQRIEGLLEKGVLSVELSERLLKAFQCFMKQRVLSETRSGAAGAFCDTNGLDPAEEDAVRSAVETVLNLQRIAYQRLVGQV